MRRSTNRSSRGPLLPRSLSITSIALIVLGLTNCAVERQDDATPPAESETPADTGVSRSDVNCDNNTLAGYDGLLVIAPHPDDEVLGFSGLINTYLEQGKPVEIIITTDGDAYCTACQFWKSGSVGGATCSAIDLSNFETPALDSFAELRRSESLAALAMLGAGFPTFLGYPDTGVGAAWANLENKDPSKPLRRSDFSSCESCGNCGVGYGGGPETDLTATSLMDALDERIEATSKNTLLATTHWLDGHGDHSGLGNFVKLLNDKLAPPRAMAFSVIHAHTSKGTAYPDCWYPEPGATICPCWDQDRALENPTWISDLRMHRFHSDWAAALPDDAEYGQETQLCLPERLWQGSMATKLIAIEAFASQLGFSARSGTMPPQLGGILDCSGYLISFVRSTEVFVLLEPGTASR